MAHGKANAMTSSSAGRSPAAGGAGASAARAVVITGPGRMFSAGVDLVRLLEGGAPYVREFRRP